MPCRTVEIELPDGVAEAIICGGRKRTPKCYACDRASEYQCDMPLESRYVSGKNKGKRRTCDRHLCQMHVRHGETKGVDFCMEHYPIAKAAHERRRVR